MNGLKSSSDYSKRLEAFRKSDSERDALVEEIIQNYETLKLKLEEQTDDYNNEIESRRMWQSKAKANDVQLLQLKQASDSNNFALCLLDGDGAIFTDYLYALGTDGGAEAASQLYTELRKHLKATYPDSNVSDWSIVVHVVLNLQGLGNKLQACKIISNPNELVAFGRAFGLAQPLFNFIDVGSGKERADHKIRETLRLFLHNAKHVFFGPCNDNGYLPVLEPYKRDPTIASKLTLIETTPAEPGFVQLGLERIRFPQIFRTQNLPAKPASVPTQLPLRTTTTNITATSTPFAPQPQALTPSTTSPSPSRTPSAESRTSTSWAAVGKNGASAKNINIATKRSPAKKSILLNVDDERLDERLPEQDSKAWGRFKDATTQNGNYCNSYHLNGKCPAGEYCGYVHGERLSPPEMLVLKHKARSLPCGARENCRGFQCFLGHHCKFGSECTLAQCRFADTHYNDLEPAKRVYEDGSEEWLSSYLTRSSGHP